MVLCIPGVLGTTQSNYGPQLRGLSEDFTVVSFDPRGYGKSIPPKREFQGNFFEQDAEDAAEFVYKLGKFYTSILLHILGVLSPLVIIQRNLRISFILDDNDR